MTIIFICLLSPVFTFKPSNFQNLHQTSFKCLLPRQGANSDSNAIPRRYWAPRQSARQIFRLVNIFLVIGNNVIFPGFVHCAPTTVAALFFAISWSALMFCAILPRALPGATIFNPFGVGLGRRAKFFRLTDIVSLYSSYDS